ncbi:MAG: dihydroorotase [Eubacteriales bacterium]
MNLLIKNVKIVNSDKINLEAMDILVNDGKIMEISTSIQSHADRIIEGNGAYILPGLIDAHCHLRDPGFEYKEDIVSGTRAAAIGGFTSVACMANTEPVADNQAVISYIKNKAREVGFVNVFPIGALSKGLKGVELSEIGDLKEAGAVAISDDGKPVSSAALMLKALSYSKFFNIPIISHCEDMDIASDGLMNEGLVSTLLGLSGIPAASEEVMVSRDLILAEYTKAKLHIAHVSTRLSLDLIRAAKKRGVDVTCETCPHYFTLTEEACQDFNTFAKVNPPLRTEDDRIAIIEGIKDGTIDIICTDHAPHHGDEKNVEFKLALNGMIGLETAFPLAFTNLVKEGEIKLNELVRLMSTNPAKLLNLQKGAIEVGMDADMIIIETKDEFIIDKSKFQSKSRNTPFDGYKLHGKPNYTIVSGKVVVSQGEIKCS